ncbi:hypothetical protein IWZ01DRAFT_344406 [Phyllosticta capitalensis]
MAWAWLFLVSLGFFFVSFGCGADVWRVEAPAVAVQTTKRCSTDKAMVSLFLSAATPLAATPDSPASVLLSTGMHLGSVSPPSNAAPRRVRPPSLSSSAQMNRRLSIPVTRKYKGAEL